MSNIEQEILEFLARPAYKPLKTPTLARKLKITKRRLSKYREAIARLSEAGKIREGKKGRIRLASAPGLIAGIIKRTSSGAGYVIPHEPEADRLRGDIFVAPEDVRDAHTGDEVLVRLVSRRRSGGQRCGRVEEVLVRATNRFVGTYFQRAGQGFVRVDGNTFREPVLVGDHGAKDARPDDKVVIEMLRFPMPFQTGEAVLIEVLGPRGQPGVDTLSIIHEFGLPREFPEKALEEARIEADGFNESDLDGRQDLTRETIVTIDPADARDFDDAISLERATDGHWHLAVHVADVPHFVPAGGPLDGEARIRGTSVYLPDRVLPMLPEIISNGLASLQKGKVRFARSIFMEFTADGAPLAARVEKTAIKVTRRFAYEQVMSIVRNPQQFKTRVTAKVRRLLAEMHELAMLLRSRRLKSGMLELSLPEIKIDFDREGRAVGAHPVEHDESHQIIEEFMIAANCAIATMLVDRKIDFIRRSHRSPDPAKLQAFAQFVGELDLPLGNCQSRGELQALLDRVRGTPLQHAVHYALLRSMKQAEYSVGEGWHYALAIEHYCHFTSPIRRYPDLVVHRLVDSLAGGKRRGGRGNPLELEKLAKHCSAMERRAEKAERELTKLKLLALMSERIGDEIDALITGVENFGLFCQGVEIPVEGLVHISAIEPVDNYDHDRRTMSLIGRRSGKEYRLGDRVRVIVAHVDVDARVLDFRLAAQTTKRKTKGKRKSPVPAKKKKAVSGASRDGSGRRGSKTANRNRRARRPGKRRRVE